MSCPLDNASVANNLNYLRFELQRVRPELKLIAPRLGEHRFLGMAFAWSQPHPSRGARPSILDAPDEIGLPLELQAVETPLVDCTCRLRERHE